ncbi:MAG TPA: DUF6285 domain-containing protein [Alphaproteobacteria bacterium]|nr:DUF6285 domain-containing protein [Alphaproteobacteria bacterium]
MRDRPDRDALLAIARATLIKDVLPQIASEQRMPALMVARAMEIVGREIVAGEEAGLVFAAGVAALYEEPSPRNGAAFDALMRRLAADLRADAFALDRRPAMHALLLAEARARVALGNPRYLDGE